MANPDLTFFKFEPVDVEVLCESLWHSLQRADIPDEDRSRLSDIRAQLDVARIDKTGAIIATRDLSIKEHVQVAENHTQKAFNLAHGDERQKLWVRMAIGRAQSILISLITNNRLR